MCAECSAHGFRWYHRTNSKFLKAFIVIGCCAAVFGLQVYSTKIASDFSRSYAVNSAKTTYTAEAIRYPNITICNRRYFSNHRLRGKTRTCSRLTFCLNTKCVALNISEDLANYMSMVFDPSAYSAYDAMSKSWPEYREMMARLEVELDTVLKERNMDFLQLLKQVAVKCVSQLNCSLVRIHLGKSLRCPEMVARCDFHYATWKFDECCTRFANPEPMFSAMGTCYTFPLKVAEKRAASSSRVDFLLFMNTSDLPDYRLEFKVSAAADMNGYVYAVSGADHASPTVNTNPYIANLGETRIIKLTLKQVRTWNERNREYLSITLSRLTYLTWATGRATTTTPWWRTLTPRTQGKTVA